MQIHQWRAELFAVTLGLGIFAVQSTAAATALFPVRQNMVPALVAGVFALPAATAGCVSTLRRVARSPVKSVALLALVTAAIVAYAQFGLSVPVKI
jgi:hypothetical protein